MHFNGFSELKWGGLLLLSESLCDKVRSVAAILFELHKHRRIHLLDFSDAVERDSVAGCEDHSRLDAQSLSRSQQL